MQDRISRIDENLLHRKAEPYIRITSRKAHASKSGPRLLQERTQERTSRQVAVGPRADVVSPRISNPLLRMEVPPA